MHTNLFGHILFNFKNFILIFFSQELDFEVELAFVIGKPGKNIKVFCSRHYYS